MGICVSCRRRERKAPEKRSVPGAGGPGKGAAAAELLPRRSDRLPTMANSMSNIKMTNPIKGIVSKRRRRYQKDGFNLDLAYITDRLIAMGFPAEKLEGVYRNHIDEVYRFLEKMHKDRYMIYNLCSERSYDSSKFHERVKRYAFEDHMPPEIEIIQPFCEDVHEWLSADPKNVAAVHCKAGKGRTGTMVCCYLLYSGQKATADDALKFYGTKRTHDEKGVTIPSQRRYVEYYAALLRSGLPYAPSKVHVRELVMCGGAALAASSCSPELTISQAKPPFKTPAGCQEVVRLGGAVAVRLTHCTPLCGDVRVDVYNKPKMKMRKEKLFHFWFNTFFVTAELGACRVPPLHDSPNLETFKLTLNKWQLDDAHKDKQHKHYSQDFKVELIIQKMPESSTFSAAGARAPSPPSSTSSSGSEPDTEPDAHWDSGEHPYYPLPDYAAPDYAAPDYAAPDYAAPDRARAFYALGDTTPPKETYFLDDGTCPKQYYTGEDAREPRYPRDKNREAFYPPDETTTKETCYPANETRRSRDKARKEYHRNETIPHAADPFYPLDKTNPSKHPSRIRDKTDHQKNPGCPLEKSNSQKDPFYPRNEASPRDPFYLNSSAESDSYLLPEDGFIPTSDPPETYYKLTTETTKTESSEGFYKMSTNGKKSEGVKTRLSLGDVRASWREFSGKFSDSRKKKEDS